MIDPPTYPSGSRPTIAGLVKSGRLKPRPVPPLGRHSDEREDNPQAVSVEQIALRCDPAVVAWFTAQQASDTRRIQRVALPALDGAA